MKIRINREDLEEIKAAAVLYDLKVPEIFRRSLRAYVNFCGVVDAPKAKTTTRENSTELEVDGLPDSDGWKAKEVIGIALWHIRRQKPVPPKFQVPKDAKYIVKKMEE